MPSFKYCLETLRQTDHDRYLTVLFAPKDKRDALVALYTFNAEISQIRETVKEPLVGEIRLRWWRDAIEAGNIESAQGHPILKALLEVIKEHNLPKAAFVHYCDARIFDLYNDPMPSVNDFEGYCGETSSAIMQLACQILDADAALKSSDACGHGGVAQMLSGILKLLPMTQARGQLYIPLDIIKAVGVDVQELTDNKLDDAAKERLSSAVTALALEHYKKFIESHSHLSKSLLPAFLPMAVVVPSLKNSKKAKASIFSQVITLSPLRRYWAVLRATIKGGFVHS